MFLWTNTKRGTEELFVAPANLVDSTAKSFLWAGRKLRFERGKVKKIAIPFKDQKSADN